MAIEEVISSCQDDDRPESYLDGQEDTSQPAVFDLELERTMMSRCDKIPRTPLTSPSSQETGGCNVRVEGNREEAVTICSTPKSSTKSRKPKFQRVSQSDEDRRLSDLSPGDCARELPGIPYSKNSTSKESAEQQ